MPVPKDKKGDLRLLGMCNLLSQFVSKLSEICATLREFINMNAEVDASDDGLSVAYTSSTMTKSQKDNCDEIEKGA
ncbi:hypothetical protein LSH36_1033g00005 [Paralvinella palmiformis]|uniref:Uncharacterized protein n=1 Tax=Paralvinella palmiformis TaxID=53620 RepID=A0AAD9IXF6_9ANNE|nr:hypothetical protein LSH36_1033g00005 [Paralvinella palmiformis]